MLFFFVYRLEMKSSSFYPDFNFFRTTPWLQIIFIFISLCIFASFVIFFVLVLFWKFCQMNELSRSWVTSTFFLSRSIFFFKILKERVHLHLLLLIFVPTHLLLMLFFFCLQAWIEEFIFLPRFWFFSDNTMASDNLHLHISLYFCFFFNILLF